MQNNEMFRVVGMREAAKLLGVSEMTIRRHMHEMPPRVVLSTARRGWKLNELMGWLESRREGATDRT